MGFYTGEGMADVWVALACVGAALTGPVVPLCIGILVGESRPRVGSAAVQIGAAALGFYGLVALLPAGLWVGVASERGVESAWEALWSLPALRPALLMGLLTWELGLLGLALGFLLRWIARGSRR